MNLIEGADGRLYLHYSKGSQYRIYDQSEEGERGAPLSVLEIAEAWYIEERDDQEYGAVLSWGRGLSAGENSVKLTLAELEEYLAEGQAEEIESGVAVESPLLIKEVRDYFNERKNAREKAKRECTRKLEGSKVPGKESKGDAQYLELLNKQKELEKQIARAVVRGTDFGNLMAQYEQLIERRKEIITKNGFDWRLYLPEENCPHCDGTGVIKQIIRKGNKEKDEKEIAQYRICICAEEQEDEIKAYCAEIRLQKRLAAEWANGSARVARCTGVHREIEGSEQLKLENKEAEDEQSE